MHVYKHMTVHAYKQSMHAYTQMLGISMHEWSRCMLIQADG